jgi:hypothetical protein
MLRMRLRTGQLVIFALATISASCCLVAQNNGTGLPMATVHVEAFGPFGSKIPTSQLQFHLFATDRKGDFARADEGPILAGVPYGRYKLSASDSGGGFAERELVVNTKDVWIRIGLSFPSGERLWPGGDLTISGDIKPKLPISGDWWVRIEGVYLNASREGPVLPSGKFSIGGLEMGTYIVEVFEGSKLRHTETVDIDIKEPNTHLTVAFPQ